MGSDPGVGPSLLRHFDLWLVHDLHRNLLVSDGLGKPKRSASPNHRNPFTGDVSRHYWVRWLRSQANDSSMEAVSQIKIRAVTLHEVRSELVLGTCREEPFGLLRITFRMIQKRYLKSLGL
jgi:hypothetical protein